MSKAHLDKTQTSLHALIIGGGIGGLCLAQGLKQSGISVAVYERDRSAHFRGQGYRIHINPDGSQALHDCLPEHLFNLFVATSGKPAMGRLVNYDSQLREVNSRPLHQSLADAPFPLSTEVNRLTLREILLADLDDIVHFDKTLERTTFAERKNAFVLQAPHLHLGDRIAAPMRSECYPRLYSHHFTDAADSPYLILWVSRRLDASDNATIQMATPRHGAKDAGGGS